MEPYLELISYIAPPAIYFPPVPETGRRRLFGGDYPAAFVGDSFRIFGGHDYGYVVPRTAKGGDMTKIRAFTKGNAYLGFAITFALALGNAMQLGARRGMMVFVLFVLVNEAYSYWLSSDAKKVTYQQLLAEFTQMERTVGLGLDAGKPVQQIAAERFAGFQRGETRFVSGSSMLYGALCGHAIARAGLVLKDAYFWPKGGRNAVISYQVGNAVMLSNFWMWAQEKRLGVKTGIAHDKHFKSMAFGYLVGYFNIV